jgi:hypothetical protein
METSQLNGLTWAAGLAVLLARASEPVFPIAVAASDIEQQHYLTF